MVTVFPLASGSSGNSFYISAGEGCGGLLVDVGISCRRIVTALTDAGIDPAGLRGVLVTHDHIDHINGLRVLAKHLRLPVYGSTITLGRLAPQMEPDAVLIPLEETAEIASIGVTPFATQHDAEGSCGFRMETGSRVIGFATDLGTVTPTVMEHLRGCHLAVLESNYDEHMLMACGYPYPLKQRIRSDYGHLCNRDAADAAAELVRHGTSRLVLAHLSRESNTPELALQTTRGRLLSDGMLEERDYRLMVARRDVSSPMIRF